MSTAHDLKESNYSNNWYDVDNEDLFKTEKRNFSFIIPEANGRINLNIESYPLNTIPVECYWENKTEFWFPTVIVHIYQNGKLLWNYDVESVAPIYTIFGTSGSVPYKKGDNISLSVEWNWHGQIASRDYSVVVYSA